MQMLHFVQNKKDHHDSTKYYLSTIHTYTVFPWKLFFFESGKCGNFYVVFALWQFFTLREETTREIRYVNQVQCIQIIDLIYKNSLCQDKLRIIFSNYFAPIFI